ncbi:MAG: DNA-binding GntR family transcriptional regulator [Verrucomicrobiales bacterium]|jgi:DNA-binding GntR family transcriptional regulator
MADAIRPIKITDQIAEAIRERVFTGLLKPGDRLVEKTICEDLDVSRASLREALTRLAHEHILDQIPNKGYRVPELTVERFHMVCEARQLVESEVAALAAQRASESDVRALREAAPFTPKNPESLLDPVECVRANRSFHTQIARAARNEILEKVVLTALDQDNQPYFYGIDLYTCTSPDQITREHLGIVEAIEKRNPDLARSRMLNHLVVKHDRIVRAWKEAGL